MLKERHQLFVVLLGLADALVIACACLLAWAMRRHQIELEWPQAQGWQLVRTAVVESLLYLAVPVGVVALRGFGLYRPWRDKRVLGEIAQVLKAAVVTVVGLIVAMWAFGQSLMGQMPSGLQTAAFGLEMDAGQVQVVVLAVLLPILLMAARIAFRVTLREMRRRGRNLRHVAVVGTGRLGRVVCRTLDRNSWTGIHVAYFVHHHDHEGQAEVLGRPVKGTLSQIEAVLDREPVDAVYLALPNARAPRMPELLRRLEKFPVDVRIVPDVSPRHSPLAMATYELEGMPILSVRESPVNGVSGLSKRVLDVVGASAALMVFGVPMLLIALAIKLTSPGPVIFKQRRVSLGGEEFAILKFRTMHHVDDERQPATWTARNDPRVTRIGRLLRQTSLDELPQLFNVLAGDMSLVGPRPERPELIAKFREDWRGYMLRQHVKAGITGWAQVNGLRGDTSLRKRIQLDLFYVRNWSLGFDLWILWLTLFRGFVHRNAH